MNLTPPTLRTRVLSFVEQHSTASVLLLLLLGLSLRLNYLTVAALNPDEGINYITAGYSSLYKVWHANLPNRNPFPPYFLLHFMLKVGDSEWWLRSLSMVGGLAAIYGGYLAGREAGGKPAGLVMAFLLTVSPMHIRLSQVLRYYSPMIACLVLGLFFFLRWHKKEKLLDAMLFGISMILAVTFHYVSVVFIFVAGLYSANWTVRRGLKRNVLVQLGFAYLPIALVLGFYFFTHIVLLQRTVMKVGAVSPWLAPLYTESLSQAWTNTCGAFGILFGEYLVAENPSSAFKSGLIYLPFFVAGCILLKMRRQGDVAILCLIPLPIALVLSNLHMFPFGNSRHIMYLTPLVFLPVSVAIQEMVWARRHWVSLIGLAALLSYGTIHTMRNDKYLEFPTVAGIEETRRCAQDFLAKTEPGDVILMDLQTLCTISYYLDLHYERHKKLDFEVERCRTPFQVDERTFIRRRSWNLMAEDFLPFVTDVAGTPELQGLEEVWIFDAGWDFNLQKDFEENFPDLELLELTSYGDQLSLMRIRLPEPDPDQQLKTAVPG